MILCRFYLISRQSKSLSFLRHPLEHLYVLQKTDKSLYFSTFTFMTKRGWFLQTRSLSNNLTIGLADIKENLYDLIKPPMSHEKPVDAKQEPLIFNFHFLWRKRLDFCNRVCFALTSLADKDGRTWDLIKAAMTCKNPAKSNKSLFSCMFTLYGENPWLLQTSLSS